MISVPLIQIKKIKNAIQDEFSVANRNVVAVAIVRIVRPVEIGVFVIMINIVVDIIIDVDMMVIIYVYIRELHSF